eukprot:516905-Ditylum_brightwellii.AAC.1
MLSLKFLMKGEKGMVAFQEHDNQAVDLPLADLGLGLAPLFHSAVSLQLHQPLYGPVTGRTAMDSTFRHPHPGFESNITDFQYSMKHA